MQTEPNTTTARERGPTDENTTQNNSAPLHDRERLNPSRRDRLRSRLALDQGPELALRTHPDGRSAVGECLGMRCVLICFQFMFSSAFSGMTTA